MIVNRLRPVKLLCSNPIHYASTFDLSDIPDRERSLIFLMNSLTFYVMGKDDLKFSAIVIFIRLNLFDHSRISKISHRDFQLQSDIYNG